MENTTAAPARCSRPGCNRILTSPKSIALGFGPVCYRRIKQAALDTRYSTDVQAKADELIELAGKIRLRGDIFLFPNTDGTATYRATPHICNCPSGLKQRTAKNGRRVLCKHQRAAEKMARASFAPTRVFAL